MKLNLRLAKPSWLGGEVKMVQFPLLLSALTHSLHQYRDILLTELLLIFDSQLFLATVSAVEPLKLCGHHEIGTS